MVAFSHRRAIFPISTILFSPEYRTIESAKTPRDGEDEKEKPDGGMVAPDAGEGEAERQGVQQETEVEGI